MKVCQLSFQLTHHNCRIHKAQHLGLKKEIVCLHIFFGQKYMFYAGVTLFGSWEGGKNFGVGIFLNKNLLG